ncbi:hypothetical protein TSMEX_004770 [Taenia solium]|eukprot:TsM_000853700 transcript=TsM_000853700 gene=TsM_000853700
MGTLRTRCVGEHFLFLYIEEGELTLNAYSFNQHWSSRNGSLPLTSNTVLIDAFVSVRNIEVERNGADVLTVRWNEAETGKFSSDLHKTLGSIIFRRLFDGIATGAEEITKLSSANQELRSLTDSAVNKYSDLAIANAEREQLLFARFAALLEKSKAQQNDSRIEQAAINLAPLSDVEAADLPNSKRLVGERLMKTLAHRVSPKKARKR